MAERVEGQYCRKSGECRPQPNKLCVLMRDFRGAVPPGDVSLGKWERIEKETRDEEANCAAPDIVENQIAITRRQKSGAGQLRST